ncbi:MAG: hypothetical protein WCA10_01765 [Terracidiphilus sp.]
MKVRLVLALFFALFELTCSPVVALRGQDVGDNATSGQSRQLTDREKNDLRGPVRSVIEERAYLAWTDADGKVFQEFRSWNKTEYDRDGRIAETRFRGSSREHGFDGTESATRYIYSESGQLLRKTTQSSSGEPQEQVVYQYDNQGRLQSITDSRDPNNPIAFRYDANGKKTKIAIAHPFDLPQGPDAISRNVEASFESAGSAATLPEGGSAVTLYDEHDRPTEIQTCNASGKIVSRTLRVYDDRGRIVEEKQTMDDPLKMIPAGDQKKIFASGGIAPQELRDQLAQFLGGSEMWSMKYSYDAQGRRSKMTRTVFNHMEEEVESAYDEHGDVAKEFSQNTVSGTGKAEADGTRSTERNYSYEYDSYGNWTVKKSSSRSLPDGTFMDAGDEMRRTLEYF